MANSIFNRPSSVELLKINQSINKIQILNSIETNYN